MCDSSSSYSSETNSTYFETYPPQVRFIPTTQAACPPQEAAAMPTNTYVVPTSSTPCANAGQCVSVPIMQIPGPVGPRGAAGKGINFEMCRFTSTLGQSITAGTIYINWNAQDQCGSKSRRCIGFLKSTVSLGGTLFTNIGSSPLYLQVEASTIFDSTYTNALIMSIDLFTNDSCNGNLYGANGGIYAVNSKALIVLASGYSFMIRIDAFSSGITTTLSDNTYLQLIKMPCPTF